MEPNLSRMIPFIYSVNVAPAANAQAQTTLTLASDSTFELHEFVGSTDADASTTVLPNNFTVSINILGGLSLMNNPVPQRVICCPANRVIQEMRLVVFPPNAQIAFAFLNLTADVLNIFFGMKGCRYFG